MKRFINNMRLMNKMVIITLVICISTAGIGLFSGVIYVINNYKKHLIENTIEDTQLIGNYLVIPMEFNSPQKAHEVLERLYSKGSISNCLVFDSHDSLFTSIHFDGEVVTQLPTFKTSRVILDNKYIHVFQPIIYNERFYGNIYVKAHSKLGQLKTEYTLLSLALLLCIMVMVFTLSWLFLKPIVNPIKRLSSFMLTISESKNYALRIEEHKGDETGHLYSSFNNLLDIIHTHEVEKDLAIQTLKQNEKELIAAKELAEEGEYKLHLKNKEFESLNRELLIANEDLKLSKEKAEESERLKTAFLQNMSHEVRTPMNAIVGFSGFLDNPDLTVEKRQHFTSIIRSSANQLLSIVTDILTISSLETKQEKVNIDKVDLNGVFVELTSVFKQLAEAKHIGFSAMLPLQLSQPQIFADRTKVVQVMTNLISNALKFTSDGYIEFGYRNVVIKDVALLEFYVKDTGIGIADNEKYRIFERFLQANKDIQFTFGGTGLGLSISKGLVELMGGTIWVESELEKGSTFYFTIPFNPVENTASSGNTSGQNEESGVKKLTVLVAEDDIYSFTFLDEMLKHLNINVLQAINGQESIDICRNNPGIDLIMMDIKMPVMDGYTAAKHIKTFRNDVPIIAQTAYALDHERVAYGGNIFDDYLTKPIDKKKLELMLSKFLTIRG